MRKREIWIVLASVAVVVLSTVLLYVFLFRVVWARNFYYYDDLVEHFNEGIFYHTALSLQDNGEVGLLPIGLAHPWEPGNNTGFPPTGSAAAVYYDDYIYVIGGDNEIGAARKTVYFTTIYTDIYTVTGRLADWTTTTALPTEFYPNGVIRHEAAALNGFLYVFGGQLPRPAQSPTITDVVMFAPIGDDGLLGDWITTTALPAPLYGMESVVLHDRIYVIGGGDASGVGHSEVYVADPDPVTGHIDTWSTTLSLPPIGQGGYLESAVATLGGRIYVYGGIDKVNQPSYSVWVHYARPLTSTGAITEWTWIYDPVLPQNCFYSEGAAYESGLLLAVSGIWAAELVPDPSPDVRVTLVDETGWTEEWVSTIALPSGRFGHVVVQDADGWLYSIGGTTGRDQQAPRLDEVQVATPYGYGGGGQQRWREAVQLHRSSEPTPTQYAPDGFFTSRMRDLQVADAPSKLEDLAWNTTITDGDLMQITLFYRYRDPYGWTPWFGPFTSNEGIRATTTIDIEPPPGYEKEAELFQYRAVFSTAVPTRTPLLNQVRIGTLAPPDLVAEGLTVTGCEDCPALIPENKPVQIEFTVRNDSTDVDFENNYLAMVFIVTETNYIPSPPDCPLGCDCNDPRSCPLIWELQYDDILENETVVLTTSYTFTIPADTYYLVGYIDYNDTEYPPHYNVNEFNEFNNSTKIVISVGEKSIYLPVVTKGYATGP